MNSEARKLRNEVGRIERELASASRSLADYEGRCAHSFTESYDPVRHKGYVSPPHFMGPMAVGWIGVVEIPDWYEDRWKRECSDCGLVQYTKAATEEKVIKRTPRWPIR